jgi:hypothetical protein
MVYAAVQAIRASKAIGTTEEANNLKDSMAELAEAWPLANSVMFEGS